MRSKLFLILVTVLCLQSHLQSFEAHAQVKADFVSEEGGFKIAFPGKPAKKVSPVDSAFGKTSMTMFSLSTTLAFYGVTYMDLPSVITDEAEQDIRFDLIRDTLVRTANGKLMNEKDLMFGDYRGREFEIEANGATATIRILSVEQRFFQLTMVARGLMSKSTERVRNANRKRVDDFFDSFAVTKLPSAKTVTVELPSDFGVKIENSNLRIDFFGLTAALPDSWTILSREEVDFLKDLGAQAKENESEKEAKATQLSLKNTEILLMLTKEPIDSGINTATFLISAEKVLFPNFLPEAAVREYVKNTLGPTEKVVKPVAPIEIGGVKFYWVETLDSADKSKSRLFLTNRKGIAFQILISYENEADLQTMLKIVQSIKFDGETVK